MAKKKEKAKKPPVPVLPEPTVDANPSTLSAYGYNRGTGRYAAHRQRKHRNYQSLAIKIEKLARERQETRGFKSKKARKAAKKAGVCVLPRGKIAYRTRRDALEILAEIKNTRHELEKLGIHKRIHRMEQNAYECPACGYWHLTSMATDRNEESNEDE